MANKTSLTTNSWKSQLPKISHITNSALITKVSLNRDPWDYDYNDTLSLEMRVPNKYTSKARDVQDLISMIFYGDIRLRSDFIEKVIFNNPATVILWADGTKTVVKCQDGEKYDPEKGLAMALVKKMCGNKGNYYNIFTKVFKKFGPEEKE